MNDQNELSRRNALARADRKTTAIPPASVPSHLVGGVAKIVSNDDDGEYTITQQVYDSSEPEWIDAVAPVGLVEVAARDYRDRSEGTAGDYVRFWQQRRADGVVENLIDVDGRRWFKVIDGTDLGCDTMYPIHSTSKYGIGWFIDECDSDGTIFYPSATRTDANVWIPTIVRNASDKNSYTFNFWPIPIEVAGAPGPSTETLVWPWGRYWYTGEREIDPEVDDVECNYYSTWITPMPCPVIVTSVSSTGCADEGKWDLPNGDDVIVLLANNYASTSTAAPDYGPQAAVDDEIVAVPLISGAISLCQVTWFDSTPRIPAKVGDASAADNPQPLKYDTNDEYFWVDDDDT